MNLPIFDYDLVRSCLSHFLTDGAVTELRALDASLRGDRRVGTVSGYFDCPEKLITALQGIASARGVYFVPNRINPQLLARACNRLRITSKTDPLTGDKDILHRLWLPIDLDPVRPSGIGSTHDEHAAARDRAIAVRDYLRLRGWPEPIFADSGNGAHLLYRIDIPAEDHGLVQRVLTHLSEHFDDDAVKLDRSVFNPARIWKLYGSRACKGDAVPDRPHRMSSILEVPATMVPVDITLLEQLGGVAASESTPQRPPAAAPRGSFDLHDWISRHLPQAEGPREWMAGGERWSLPTCPFNSSHVGGSAYIGRLPNGAICAGCHHNSCSGWGWKELREHLTPSPSGKPHDCTRIDEVSPTASPSVPHAFVPFPLHLLPQPISSYIKDAATAMSCDTALITLPMLAALACTIGTTHRIELKPGWTEPAIVWAVPVSESGTVKTPAQRAALKFLREAQDSAFQAYELDRADFEARKCAYELELEEWKRKAKKSPTSTGEMPQKPAEPVATRYCVSDVTIEALVPLLQANPRGLLLVRDEVSGWVASFDAYKSGGKGGGDAAHYLSLHSGESITVDRKSGMPRTIHVPLGALSIAGGIQPGVLAKLMSKDHRESGLLARILLAQPPRRPKVWTEKSVAAELEARVRAVFGRLLALEHDRDPCDPETECRAHIVTLTPEAKQAFVEFFNMHNKQQAELSGDLAAAWSKLEGYAARFALISHLVRYAANDPAVPSPLTPIDEASMRAGIAISQWFARETERVYAMMTETPGAKATRELLEWIAARGGVVTANDLANGKREFKQDREGAELALVSLVERGLGDWEPVPPGSKGGRPTRRFRLRRTSADDTVPATNRPRSDQDPPASAENWGEG